MAQFSNKVAAITGAGSGIGRALALELARNGASLALSDVDQAGLDQTMQALRTGTRARSYQLDVTSQDAVFAHAEAVKADFATAHLLFNNAGSAFLGTFEHQTVEAMEWLIALDLWSVVYGIPRVLRPGLRSLRGKR
jgi:NADP-dependent 3-hydroxy acid dehydrogenase YdfG